MELIELKPNLTNLFRTTTGNFLKEISLLFEKSDFRGMKSEPNKKMKIFGKSCLEHVWKMKIFSLIQSGFLSIWIEKCCKFFEIKPIPLNFWDIVD